jgi:hypothetical protein
MDEQPGTFFLTDFLVRGFEGTVLKGLGLDRFPQLQDTYFANYTRLVYLIQQEDQALLEKAHTIARTLGLPLELRRTGYGQLEARLVDLMADIHQERYRPTPPQESLFAGDSERSHGRVRGERRLSNEISAASAAQKKG